MSFAIRSSFVSVRAFVPLMALCLFCAVPKGMGQTVSHPLSEISPTVKHYSYTYMLTPTTKKELEYLIVMASNGEIKTVFNACDVCYPYHKGYSQNGTEVRCNNCGNRFAIDGLGVKSTGTCNPGYLPHTIQGNDVVINVSDLIVGAYFFVTQNVTGVDEVLHPSGFRILAQNRQALTVRFPVDGRSDMRVFSMTGQLRKATGASGTVATIDISDLAPGAYLLAVQSGKMLSTKTFLVY